MRRTFTKVAFESLSSSISNNLSIKKAKVSEAVQMKIMIPKAQNLNS